MQIFKNNQFFYGLNIPEPERVEPLHVKLPQSDLVTTDFLYVRYRKFVHRFFMKGAENLFHSRNVWTAILTNVGLL